MLTKIVSAVDTRTKTLATIHRTHEGFSRNKCYDFMISYRSVYSLYKSIALSAIANSKTTRNNGLKLWRPILLFSDQGRSQDFLKEVSKHGIKLPEQVTSPSL